jgi:hypothetical protein
VTKWTGTLKGKGTEYAESDAEAETLLLAEVEHIDFSRDWLTDDQWRSVKDIACNPKYGLAEAYKSLQTEKDALAQAAARQLRKQRVDGVRLAVMGAADSVSAGVRAIIEDAARRYIERGEVSYVSPVNEMITESFEDLCEEWDLLSTRIANQAVFTNLHWMPVEDKPAAGKGNVGNTLDTREKQGCILLRVGNVKFNAHVDITD